MFDEESKTKKVDTDSKFFYKKGDNESEGEDSDCLSDTFDSIFDYTC